MNQSELIGFGTTILSGPSITGLPQDLSAQLTLLIEFSEHIKAFSNWWDWIQVEAPLSTSNRRHGRVKYRLEGLKDKSNVERWNVLMSQYTSYVNLVEWTSSSWHRRFSYHFWRRFGLSRTLNLCSFNATLG